MARCSSLMEEESKPIAIICSVCGSNRVTRDAWAEWDAANQQWVLGAVFDDAYCHQCDEETNLDEMLISEEEEQDGC